MPGSGKRIMLNFAHEVALDSDDSGRTVPTGWSSWSPPIPGGVAKWIK